MRIVTMDVHNLLIPVGPPVAVRMLLLCRTRRMTIMRVRRTLSETETERCRKLKRETVGVRGSFRPQAW